MRIIKHARSFLVGVVVLALTLKIVLWAIGPLVIPSLIGLFLLLIIGSIFFRSRRW